MNIAFKNSLMFLAAAVALLSAPALRSQTLSFYVDLNTAGLSTGAESANAPFDLDFQLNYGNSALATNTATLTNFQLTGGSAVGSGVTNGLATGSLNGSVTLTASSASPSNEFYQQFASGVTNIQFLATITEKGPNVGLPTEFTTAILDNSLGSPAQLFTTAPDTESLLTLNLDASNTVGAVDTFTSISSADGNTSVTGVAAAAASVPEPSTTAAIFGCAAVMFTCWARHFGKRQTFPSRPTSAPAC